MGNVEFWWILIGLYFLVFFQHFNPGTRNLGLFFRHLNLRCALCYCEVLKMLDGFCF